MKIKVKEVKHSADYTAEMERYNSEPTIYPKPEPSYFKYLLNIPIYDIVFYKFYPAGIDDETIVDEIKLITPYGNYMLEVDDNPGIVNELDLHFDLVERDFRVSTTSTIQQNLKKLPTPLANKI